MSKMVRGRKRHTGDEDRISSLPDDPLIMIINKLDTRTTITTKILSRRWRDLPRLSTTSYNLAVDDMLPPHYHHLKSLSMEAKAEYEADKNLHKLTNKSAIKAGHERWMAKIRPLTAAMDRYERLAMRRYVKQVDAFLLAPEDVRQRRPVQKLRLQLPGRCHVNIDAWVTAAIDKWCVEDFELIVDGYCLSYDLERLNSYRNLRLERFALFNCDVHSDWKCLKSNRLTKLSLGGLDCAYINEILTNCVELTHFRVSDSSGNREGFPINFRSSKLRNLQVDRCNFGIILLLSLTCLETFVCRGRPTEVYYRDVPSLRHVSLDFSEDNRVYASGTRRTYPPSKFLEAEGVPELDYLVMQFRGSQMWIEPLAFPATFTQLSKLFIANLPMNWDVLWILLLLDAAPALESFHVHIDKSSGERSVGDLCASLGTNAQQHQYGRLKELVVAGFDGLVWQTVFVRMIMKSSPELRRVHLLDGEVREDEQDLGHPQIVPRRRKWRECERAEALDNLTITTGFRWTPQIILE